MFEDLPLDFTNWPVNNNLNLLEVFFLVNSFYSLKYTGSSKSILHNRMDVSIFKN